MVTKEQVYEVLRNCYDPEIPVNLVDLGLIYDVQVDDDHVNVVMTLTARGCPAHSLISEQVRQQLAEIPGVKSANVQVVWDPPWDISRLSEAAKKQLGLLRE
jgi:metal-sulfur cluster biosynthetic enzyme